MKKVDPLENRILIKPTPPEKITKGGIVIPDNAREKPCEGTVVAVGPGKRLDNGQYQKVAVAEGDVVVYSKYAGTELKVNGKDHVVIRETDLICRISEIPEPAPAGA